MTHKDAPPEETVTRARTILARTGIVAQEGPWYNLGQACHSVTLRGDPALPYFSTNGKGITRPLALAAAYGEFLERLQNGGDFGAFLRRDFGLMPSPPRFHPDERKVRTTTVFARHRSLLRHLLDCEVSAASRVIEGEHEELTCVPFFDLFADRVEHLPIALLELACSNNGKCAGNSPEEALVQGICEVFERHVVSQVFLRSNGNWPTIPMSAFDGLPSRELMERLHAEGYTTAVKDGTLGGRFPVLGLVVFNRDRSKYACSFGSHPILDTALQRCITEAAQGFDDTTFEEAMQPLASGLEPGARHADHWNPSSRARAYSAFIHKHMVPFPNSFLFSRAAPRHGAAFMGRFTDNRDCLRFCISRTRQHGGRIFIRNVSFLGFPAFRVYIPGLSEVVKIDRPTLEFAFHARGVIKRRLLRIAQSSAPELRHCAARLEELESLPFFSVYQRYRAVLNLLDIELGPSDATVLPLLDPAMLLTLLRLRTGDYGAAAIHLTRWLGDSSGGEMQRGRANEYYCCAIAFMKLRSKNEPLPSIQRHLTSAFGLTRSLEIIADLHDPAHAFRRVILPHCGDCSRCPIAPHCSHDRWSEVMDRVISSMAENPVHQEDVASLRST